MSIRSVHRRCSYGSKAVELCKIKMRRIPLSEYVTFYFNISVACWGKNQFLLVSSLFFHNMELYQRRNANYVEV